MARKKKPPLLDNRPRASTASLERAVRKQGQPNAFYHLRLYISGSTPQSTRALQAVKKTCEQYLKGRYALEVIDVYQQPELARKGQVVAAPTLVKLLPEPLRRLIGDMSDREHLLVGLDLRLEPQDKSPEAATK